MTHPATRPVGLVALAALLFATPGSGQEGLSTFALPGGGIGAGLTGATDHTLIVWRAADGADEIRCLQGDTHVATTVLARLAREAARVTGAGAIDPGGTGGATVTGTLRIDGDTRSGADAEDRVLLFTPKPVQPGSSFSHFDTSANPNLLMEPSINSDLPFKGTDVSDEALRDMGWRSGSFAHEVRYTDAQGSGFNDATLGAARKAALEFTLGVWGKLLGSAAPVVVDASFDSLTCGVGGATLAQAGPRFAFRDFSGGQADTWYPGPMAESIARSDLSGSDDADLTVIFNSAIDTGCLGGGSSWYYGTDGDRPASTIAFVTVALHEIAHGLGFTGLADLETGALFQGLRDIMTSMTFDNRVGKRWDELTDGGRRKSAVREGEVAFTGKKTTRRGRKLLEGAPVLVFDAPRALEGTHVVSTAAFGPPLDENDLAGELALVDDGTADATLGCNALTNGGDVAGRIAVVDRGTCTFVTKVANAQAAGATAVIVVNNVAGRPVTLGGDDDSITIPSVMVDRRLGRKIKRRID